MLLCKRSRLLRDQLLYTARCEAQNLQLPFLSPALLPFDAQRHTYSTPAHPSNKQRSAVSPKAVPKAAPLATRSRGLASAVTAEATSPYDDIIPFDGLPTRPLAGSDTFGPDRISNLTGFDPASSPLILNNIPTTGPANFRSRHGVGGQLSDIHQVYDACLRVGQFDRAAMYLERLVKIYKDGAPALSDACRDYVREVTGTIIRTQDMKLLKELLAWFETEIKHQQHLREDGPMLALMIQACLQIKNAKQRDSEVEKYLNYASEWGVKEEAEELVPQLVTAVEAENLTDEHTPELVESIETKNTSGEIPSKLRAVDIKGPGMATLRRSLDSVESTASGGQEGRQNFTPTDRQRDLEENTVKAAIERWKIENEELRRLGINSALSERTPLGAMLWRWHEDLVSLIHAELDAGAETRKRDPKTWTAADHERLIVSPFLAQCAPERASAGTIMATMTMMSSSRDCEPRLAHLLNTIADVVTAEAAADIAHEEPKLNHWRSLSKSKFQKSISTSVFAGVGMKADGTQRSDIWSQTMKIKVAALLLSRLTKVAKMELTSHDESGQPLVHQTAVLFHSFTYDRGRKVGVLRIHPTMFQHLSKHPLGETLSKHLPMLCEPRPWKGVREGGFLQQQDPVVRMHGDGLQRTYVAAAAANGDLDMVFTGLNYLGEVPWRINRPVYEVMARVWNTGEPLANFPAADPKEDYPPEPEKEDGAKAYYEWTQKVRSIKHRNSGLRSDRCFKNFQLEIARTFLDETCYFPHNLDFRGRAYPMAPFLNHMGADHSRGLLRFAVGKELGTNGLSWLKIHLANTYGFDKASFSERSGFTELHLDDVIDSAVKPLEGRRWWLEAEDPWQCLATCMELHQALQSPDPTRFVSHMPIHTDGTCNGLQHYAALGGDAIGAAQVNLEPGDRPSDVYTAVAEMIKSEIHDEAKQGNAMAQALDGRIIRKVVKQTVMTNVYGVTVIGAERQVAKQLKEIFAAQLREGDEKVKVIAVSNYVARKIFKALKNMFHGAHEIQKWFGECANLIVQSLSPDQLAIVEGNSTWSEANPNIKAKAFKRREQQLLPHITPVIWTTPLKMPIVQPYRQNITRGVITELQGINLSQLDEIGPVHKRKQYQAFAPNFIHSLDGTHMFLTAIRSKELGLTFASVHDSFWTHACDVDTLNKVTRAAFIRMHSEHVVQRLHAEFRTRYDGHIRLASVPKDSPVGRKILKWRYDNRHEIAELKAAFRQKFKNHQQFGELRYGAELTMEAKRLRLLRSKDPEERAAGGAMVTPATIFANATNDAVAPSGSLSRQGKAGYAAAFEADAKFGMASKATEEDKVEHDVEGEGEQETEPAAEEKSSSELLGPDEGTVAPEKQSRSRTNFWVKVTFPPVPEKGGFDITRLKDSPYFFS